MDFLSDEKLRECSAGSIGVYVMLMCVLHKQKEYGAITLLPKDLKTPDAVANFAIKLALHLPFDAEEIKEALDELIANEVLHLDNDRLWQKRMVKDGLISEARATAGKKGADARYTQKSKNEFAMAKPMANNIANGEANENEEPDSEEKPKKKSLIEERFDIFYAAYPRKAGVAKAKTIWKRISPTQKTFDEIMEGLARAKKCEQWNKDHGQFIPHPATWLNQERWKDDYGTPVISNDSAPIDFNPDDPFKDWVTKNG